MKIEEAKIDKNRFDYVISFRGDDATGMKGTPYENVSTYFEIARAISQSNK